MCVDFECVRVTYFRTTWLDHGSFGRLVGVGFSLSFTSFYHKLFDIKLISLYISPQKRVVRACVRKSSRVFKKQK